MSNPGQHAASDGTWRPADLIAGFAYAKAKTLEEDSERIGIIYVLTEILTALHRQAEALETNIKLQDFLLARFGHEYPPK